MKEIGTKIFVRKKLEFGPTGDLFAPQLCWTAKRKMEVLFSTIH